MFKPVIQFQSQFLFRRSYKPQRILRVRPAEKWSVTFRPTNRFGAKPQPVTVP